MVASWPRPLRSLHNRQELHVIRGSQLYEGVTASWSDQATAEWLPLRALQNVVVGIVMLAAVTGFPQEYRFLWSVPGTIAT